MSRHRSFLLINLPSSSSRLHSLYSPLRILRGSLIIYHDTIRPPKPLPFITTLASVNRLAQFDDAASPGLIPQQDLTGADLPRGESPLTSVPREHASFYSSGVAQRHASARCCPMGLRSREWQARSFLGTTMRGLLGVFAALSRPFQAIGPMPQYGIVDAAARHSQPITRVGVREKAFRKQKPGRSTM